MNTQDLFRTRLEGAASALGSLREQIGTLAAMADLIVARLKAGGTLYSAGNGGSAAQAMHLAEEFIGRYRSNRPPLRAICLNADPTGLTCIANDFGFDQVFARQCDALLTDRDVLVAISTSGNSANLINALRVARTHGAARLGLLGRDGGQCLQHCEAALIIQASSGESAFIQEAHQVAIHLICEAAERAYAI